MSIPSFDEIIEPNDQVEARMASLAALKDLVGNVYPNKFVRSKISGVEDTITNLKAYAPVVGIVNEIKAVIATLAERERPPAELKDALNERLKAFGNVRISGRLTTPTRGNFVHLTDGINKLQIYCNKKGPLALVLNDGNDTLDEENGWAAWQLLDHGDFVGAEGYLFITNTGELSVHVEKLQFLAKAMLPMPDKMHGIADPELQRRFRYADLIASSLKVESGESRVESEIDSYLSTLHSQLSTRQVFERRARLISGLRRFLDDAGFIEVETPMLTPKATGAAAKPFETHHNALDIPLYARVAPELYLKRLLVGGFEKVYELNRNFRNEGLSQRHNPEFTMLEFYVAYMDVNGMMDLCEQMLKESVQRATSGLIVSYDGQNIDFRKFQRLGMRDAILAAEEVRLSLPKDSGFQEILLNESWLEDPKVLFQIGHLVKDRLNLEKAKKTRLYYRPGTGEDLIPLDKIRDAKIISEGGYIEALQLTTDSIPAGEIGKLESWEYWGKEFEKHPISQGQALAFVFESAVEPYLIQPTFIVDYPKTISPLSKTSPDNSSIAERFELFIAGMEVANGFSELNDPKEQYERFVDQMSERERGDEEAMVLDEDYIRALSYGMPPASGIGIGIDRLVMLLTNKHSIRDVILFPHMRPEKKEGEKGSGGE